MLADNSLSASFQRLNSTHLHGKSANKAQGKCWISVPSPAAAHPSIKDQNSHTPWPVVQASKESQTKTPVQRNHNWKYLWKTVRKQQKCFLSKEELPLPATFPLSATQDGKANPKSLSLALKCKAILLLLPNLSLTPQLHDNSLENKIKSSI